MLDDSNYQLQSGTPLNFFFSLKTEKCFLFGDDSPEQYHGLYSTVVEDDGYITLEYYDEDNKEIYGSGCGMYLYVLYELSDLKEFYLRMKCDHL